MKNIMIDLETMGTSSNSAILTIGAVEFDKDLGILDRFYEIVDLQSCLDRGFEVKADAFYWWLRQSKEAKDSLTEKKKLDIKDVLGNFQKFLGKNNIVNLQIWGNGADFDNVILQNAFKRFKVTNPWPYYSNRCFRTLAYSFPSLNIEKTEVNHRSVDDAEYQAKYLIELVNEHKLQNVL
jgi:DNA polymerase III epsilon subunit-like protein